MTAETFNVDGRYEPLFDGDPTYLEEVSSIPGAVPNTAILYAQDNGAGKTRLMVRFPTGSPVQLAIEP